jgi:sterol desaturase/sphingolipid hydroxylase (fatty acid hydroxylase superfamily)
MPSAPYSTWFAPYLLTLEHCGHALSNVLFNPGSAFSTFSLACALFIAVAFLAYRRARKGRTRHSLKVLARALFPRWFWCNASMRADLVFFIFNCLAVGSFIGWGLVSGDAVNRATLHAMDSVFGLEPPALFSHIGTNVVLTVAMFVAYDFGYWVDHFLKHKVPMLWEFHRVHHTAEVLSPLTNARVHPVDSLIFANITGISIGLAHGVGSYFLGAGAREAVLSGTNVILLAFIFLVVHLQHSHVAIHFGRTMNKVLFSPAHHHIHHSTRQEHFDRNLGSCLAVWDWMFGTLIQPQEVAGQLTFGVDTESDRYTPHSVAGALVLPFVRAAKQLMPHRTSSASNTAYPPPSHGGDDVPRGFLRRP